MGEPDDTITPTNDMNPWRAGCSESCTSGSEGGPQKPTHRKMGRALRPDPYTYIPTGEGWLFVASVLDVCTRLIVGWSIADHLRTELCTDAMAAAAATRGRRSFAGTVFHSDHGCQYTSAEFKACCERMGIVQSMGTVGDSYDNAMAESLWSSLKRELVDDAYFATKEEARLAIFEWIAWYNTERLHSSLDYMSPREYEEFWQDQQAA